MAAPTRVARRSARPRWLYAIAVAVTIAAGLGSRAVAARPPGWLAKSAGDALYAVMVFWGLAIVAPRAPAARLAAGALAFCVAIELSQLYRAPWIEALRATSPGRLALGQGFHAFDLVCYAIGAALAVAIETAAEQIASHRART